MSSGALKKSISYVDTEYGRVMLDEAKSLYWHANPTAALLLDVLEGGGDAEEAARRIVSRFDIDERTAMADVRGAIDQLRERGLLS
ncbi:lasso peptide biosynthesis PqqD family chaperone [Nocardia arthritidis]|uniref:Lasso peptide biosynthesis PqqD family chaperone n=1 Tax=Nocardia arthritidis TaxID=228602 RepID=A0A6G9YLR9_9NOCA|nr:lasso peptide biosynthesis PqqD family chaperone [Nocardia arthritidis]QIS14142.1 lasso peptide biosynthesis PqqD family chaperone [Nocardia arthritidis]